MLKLKFKSLIDLQEQLSTEKDCFDYMMQVRWEGKPKCVYCNHDSVCTVKDGDFKCAKCNKRFTIKTGTIFEGSKVSLKKWLMAIYFTTNDKKGVSSYQLANNIGVTQKTAWFMLHRLKHLLTASEFEKSEEFSGVVEIDEAYIGGKEGNRHAKDKKETGEKEKTVVLGIVERDTGKVKTMKVVDAQKEHLLPKINVNVKNGSTIITDTYMAYKSLKKRYKHKSVKHSNGEYVRTEAKTAFKIHTNTVEGYWAIVKRTIYGTHHWVSKKHIQAYLNEMGFRYSYKDFSLAERFDAMSLHLKVRLRYKQLIAK